MEGGGRKEVRLTAAEAVQDLRDGMSIIIGGFINSSHPMALVRQMIRRGLRNLTVIGASSAGLDVDLLIVAGCVRRVIAPYVGGESLAPIGPYFRHAAQKGLIEVWECDEAHYYQGLRAAAQGLPFLPIRAGLGTSYPEINPDLKVFTDPIRGEPLVAVPAIVPDVAFIHAAQADPYGNAQHEGSGFGDREQYLAARRTIVQVERVVTNADIRRDPYRTSIPEADGVVWAPWGAHPFESPAYYRHDSDHIREYVAAVEAETKRGDAAPLQRYLERHVYGPATHVDYLEVIGLRRLLDLSYTK